MSIHFVTAHGDGFLPGDISSQPDGSVMVSVGSTIEREGQFDREEQIELWVRVANASGQTIEQIQAAAIERASVIIEAAGRALPACQDSRSS